MNSKKVTIVRRIVFVMAMLITSMYASAQRETLTFDGSMGNFPHGGSAEVTLTVKPDGTFHFDIKKSETVGAFTIDGLFPAPLYEMPGSDGQRGPKAEGFNWALQVTDFTAFSHQGEDYRPAPTKPKGMMMGRTEKDKIQLRLSLKALLPDGRPFTMPLECTLKKESSKESSK